MTKIKRATPDNPDFVLLVKELDAYLKGTDGAEHDFYHQFNGITSLQYVVVAYVNDQAVGCGALKEFNTDTLEICVKLFKSSTTHRLIVYICYHHILE